MLTKTQFIQALRDTPIDPDIDPVATLSNLSEDASAVDFGLSAQVGGIVVTATVSVEVLTAPAKKRKAAGEEDDGGVDLLEQTGFAILTTTSMVDVEKAQQNAVRNAINLMGGIAEYIPVAPPVSAAVVRPMAQPQSAPTTGVVAQAQAVASAAGAPTCADCHQAITEVQSSFGLMDPYKYASWTTKKTGRPLCKTCNGKDYAKRQNGG